MNLYAISARELATQPLPSPCALLLMADSKEQLAAFRADDSRCSFLADMIFNDADLDYGLVRSPNSRDATQILEWYVTAKHAGVSNFVAQCQAGIGRSQAVIAALAKIEGKDNTPILRNGTYNRKLYRLILEAAGVAIDPEPLVSIVCRVKYDWERVEAFMLSLRRQRYSNWELIFVGDGRGAKRGFVWDEEYSTYTTDERIHYMSGPKPLGRWGHPYRQLGIDAARGEFIGLQNDDNYLTPGFIEQLVFALQEHKADVALCHPVHSYSGWAVTPAGSDLGSWIARAEVIRSHPWTGVDFDSDLKYLGEICKGRKVVTVNRPLFVHN